MAMLFVEDVQVYKVISRPSLRLRYAKQMVSQYLNTSRGATPGGPPDIVIENQVRSALLPLCLFWHHQHPCLCSYTFLQHSSEHLLHSMGSYFNIPLLSERVLKPRPYHFQRPGWNLRSALQARLNEPALTMMSRAFFLKYEDPHSLIGLGGLPIKRIVDVVDGMNEVRLPLQRSTQMNPFTYYLWEGRSLLQEAPQEHCHPPFLIPYAMPSLRACITSTGKGLIAHICGWSGFRCDGCSLSSFTPLQLITSLYVNSSKCWNTDKSAPVILLAFAS